MSQPPKEHRKAKCNGEECALASPLPLKGGLLGCACKQPEISICVLFPSCCQPHELYVAAHLPGRPLSTPIPLHSFDQQPVAPISCPNCQGFHPRHREEAELQLPGARLRTCRRTREKQMEGASIGKGFLLARTTRGDLLNSLVLCWCYAAARTDQVGSLHVRSQQKVTALTWPAAQGRLSLLVGPEQGTPQSEGSGP